MAGATRRRFQARRCRVSIPPLGEFEAIVWAPRWVISELRAAIEGVEEVACAPRIGALSEVLTALLRVRSATVPTARIGEVLGELALHLGCLLAAAIHGAVLSLGWSGWVEVDVYGARCAPLGAAAARIGEGDRLALFVVGPERCGAARPLLLASGALAIVRRIVVGSRGVLRIGTARIPLREPEIAMSDLPPNLVEALRTYVVEPERIGARYGARKLLVVGPPGVGKTSLAEAIASELQRLVARIGPQFYRSMWYGETERGLWRVFDALSRRRFEVVASVEDVDYLVGRQWDAPYEGFAGELAAWLSVLERDDLPITLLTTNAPWMLDPALVRCGRVDLVVVMGYPDRDQRLRIARRTAQRYGVRARDEELELVAERTRWFSPAEVATLIRVAAAECRGVLEERCVEEALRRFVVDREARRSVQEQLRSLAQKHGGLVVVYAPLNV